MQTHSSRWWLAPVIGLIVLFTAGAGLAAHSLYHASGSATGAPGSGTTTTNSAGLTPTPSPSANSTTPVLAADAAAYPQSAKVADALNSYFDAINHHAYQSWRAAVTAAVANEQGSSEADWRTNFRTTSDTDIMIYRIDVSSNGQLQALVSFTSNQSPQFSPDKKSACDHWRIVYPLAPSTSGSNTYLVAGAIAQYAAC